MGQGVKTEEDMRRFDGDVEFLTLSPLSLSAALLSVRMEAGGLREGSSHMPVRDVTCTRGQ